MRQSAQSNGDAFLEVESGRRGNTSVLRSCVNVSLKCAPSKLIERRNELPPLRHLTVKMINGYISLWDSAIFSHVFHFCAAQTQIWDWNSFPLTVWSQMGFQVISRTDTFIYILIFPLEINNADVLSHILHPHVWYCTEKELMTKGVQRD